MVKRDLGQQYDDLDVHVHPFAPGGYEMARVHDFWHTGHMMLGYVKNRQPVLFHSHPGAIHPYDGEEENIEWIVAKVAL